MGVSSNTSDYEEVLDDDHQERICKIFSKIVCFYLIFILIGLSILLPLLFAVIYLVNKTDSYSNCTEYDGGTKMICCNGDIEWINGIPDCVNTS